MLLVVQDNAIAAIDAAIDRGAQKIEVVGGGEASLWPGMMWVEVPGMTREVIVPRRSTVMLAELDPHSAGAWAAWPGSRLLWWRA